MVSSLDTMFYNGAVLFVVNSLVLQLQNSLLIIFNALFTLFVTHCSVEFGQSIFVRECLTEKYEKGMCWFIGSNQTDGVTSKTIKTKPLDGIFILFHGWSLLVCRLSVPPNPNDPTGNNYGYCNLKISCLFGSLKTISDFVESCFCVKNVEKDTTDIYEDVTGGGYWTKSIKKGMRSFDSVIFPDMSNGVNIANDIYEDCVKFLSQREWYVTSLLIT